jgi:hypothetical protein
MELKQKIFIWVDFTALTFFQFEKRIEHLKSKSILNVLPIACTAWVVLTCIMRLFCDMDVKMFSKQLNLGAEL